MARSLLRKRLELLKETVPELSRVAVLSYPTHPVARARVLKETGGRGSAPWASSSVVLRQPQPR